MVARLAVAVVALAAVGWLAVLERDQRLLSSGSAAGGRLSTPGSYARGDRDLRAARLLNPDSAPDYTRAILYRGAGRFRASSALLEDVLRREPDNLQAWALLYQFSAGRDPASAQRALAARRRLDPLNARAR
jgi:predicted Zn-dependent protease